MASQVSKVLDRNMLIKELEKTYDLTTLLQQEIASIPQNSVNSEVGLMFEELLHALRLSLNILYSSEVIRNNRIRGSPKRTRVEDYQEEPDNRNVHKEVHTPKPHDDGYQWRKYGRKNILNNKFPRDYYRCTYSSDYNCKAKKYIQKHYNGDPPLYKVIYIHNHTCTANTVNSKKIQGFSANEMPQPPLSLSSYGVERKEEQAVYLSCLKNVIAGTSRDQQMDNPLYGFDDVVSQQIESSSIDLPSSYHASETDDIVTMDLFWPELPEMDML